MSPCGTESYQRLVQCINLLGYGGMCIHAAMVAIDLSTQISATRVRDICHVLQRQQFRVCCTKVRHRANFLGALEWEALLLGRAEFKHVIPVLRELNCKKILYYTRCYESLIYQYMIVQYTRHLKALNVFSQKNTQPTQSNTVVSTVGNCNINKMYDPDGSTRYAALTDSPCHFKITPTGYSVQRISHLNFVKPHDLFVIIRVTDNILYLVNHLVPESFREPSYGRYDCIK